MFSFLKVGSTITNFRPKLVVRGSSKRIWLIMAIYPLMYNPRTSTSEGRAEKHALMPLHLHPHERPVLPYLRQPHRILCPVYSVNL